MERAEGELSWWMWVWLVALISVNKAFVSGSFTTIAILNNNSISSEWRGRVGGLTMMVASVFKALGPSIGAVIFAWSLTNGYTFPLDFHFAFVAMALGAFAAAFWAARVLPHALNNPPP
jgi:hypothetical protein